MKNTANAIPLQTIRIREGKWRGNRRIPRKKWMNLLWKLRLAPKQAGGAEAGPEEDLVGIGDDASISRKRRQEKCAPSAEGCGTGVRDPRREESAADAARARRSYPPRHRSRGRRGRHRLWRTLSGGGCGGDGRAGRRRATSPVGCGEGGGAWRAPATQGSRGAGGATHDLIRAGE